MLRRPFGGRFPTEFLRCCLSCRGRNGHLLSYGGISNSAVLAPEELEARSTKYRSPSARRVGAAVDREEVAPVCVQADLPDDHVRRYASRVLCFYVGHCAVFGSSVSDEA